jgi:MFS family permease
MPKVQFANEALLMTEPPHQHRWRFPGPLGTVDAKRAVGTVAAPLLAGFSLTTIGVLLTAGTIPERDWGITIFVVAAVMFVFCMQFTYMGLMYAASPSERVDWMPRVPGREPDEAAYANAGKVQEKDLKLQNRYFTRVGTLYNFGILAYTTGLALILVPRTWTIPRGIALAILAGAFVLEAIWTITDLIGHRVQWLLPGYRSLAQKRDRQS